MSSPSHVRREEARAKLNSPHGNFTSSAARDLREGRLIRPSQPLGARRRWAKAQGALVDVDQRAGEGHSHCFASRQSAPDALQRALEPIQPRGRAETDSLRLDEARQKLVGRSPQRLRLRSAPSPRRFRAARSPLSARRNAAAPPRRAPRGGRAAAERLDRALRRKASPQASGDARERSADQHWRDRSHRRAQPRSMASSAALGVSRSGRSSLAPLNVETAAMPASPATPLPRQSRKRIVSAWSSA